MKALFDEIMKPLEAPVRIQMPAIMPAEAAERISDQHAERELPDFSAIESVREVVPAALAAPIANLMTVFQMGNQADREELMKASAQIERALLLLWRDL